MAKVALIQSIFRVLNYASSDNLHGLEKQIWDDFYEALEEEYNHSLYTARTLDEYRTKSHPAPEVILCAPLAEEGNPPPAWSNSARFKKPIPACRSSCGARAPNQACARPAWKTTTARPTTPAPCSTRPRSYPAS